MLSPSISIALNAVNASNWRYVANDIADEMSEFHGRWKMRAYAAYLKMHGAWNAWKDRMKRR